MESDVLAVVTRPRSLIGAGEDCNTLPGPVRDISGCLGGSVPAGGVTKSLWREIVGGQQNSETVPEMSLEGFGGNGLESSGIEQE